MQKNYPKLGKLAKQPDIRAVARARRRCQAGSFVVNWRTREDGQTASRLCVVIRKKSIPSAVRRNRMKRLVREFFRQNQNQFAKKADFLVHVNRFESIQYKDIAEILTKALAKAGVLQ
ncbi:MAG: ribonuclease P protein component [Candidatus Omnitrophica bacterium CG11_big_fil_rev_8_21_14_0_20_45_26]|uniref:Ribonuclease P protein component n=1 Tax=Candidatus Abzuiibacterium crystallinum TaxID=1974748 RepID=A0A2H0LNG8_9BACT|nr:MAG: ribonuclease P protein component [Candidatus Omnitrophica bacterium CG11_big_fil_rev_8_21_14_0_20_45_26]PIW64727.1 MAG: ribonuclease P protein component [Candidatus Omnitrophica bacterium CG12_big_fil_rev_8_21_14_0_65_45_16]